MDNKIDPIVAGFFQFLAERYVGICRAWVDDPEAVVADAAQRYAALVPTLAYRDNPGHPMATGLFFTACALAMQQALDEHGVGVHEFGPALLQSLRDDPVPDPDWSTLLGTLEASSEAPAKPGEFVVEVVAESDSVYGMNVKSCAVCALYSQHDAMELVPYMCATDDAMSEAADDGLRRTGTIALGAHQCDFRYQKGGERLGLAEQYPERIHLRPSR